MRLYADHPDRRTRQVAGDVLAVLAVAGAVPAGFGLYRWLDQYGEAGDGLRDSADALAGNLYEAADRLDGLPLVGGTVAEPLRNSADSAANISVAGANLRDFVSTTATLSAVTAVAVILAAVLFGWLARRVAWVREAESTRAAMRSADGLDLLALRALAGRPGHDVELGDESLVTGWRSGDPAAIHALATAELTRLGLTAPSHPAGAVPPGPRSLFEPPPDERSQPGNSP